jgi:hypothetical protein
MQILMQATRTGFDFEKVTVSTVAVGLTATKYAHATTFIAGALREQGQGTKAFGATIYVEGADVRAVFSPGQVVAPVAATTGLLFGAGTFFEITGEANLRDVRFIRESGSDASLQVQYWS